MTAPKQAAPLIRTKLHRPRVAADLVQRERLYAALERSHDEPLTLVSAPAGYGKTALISNWLARCDLPNAWLSLDETDSDTRVFFSYFVAAVHKVFPETCRETLTLLEANQLASPTLLAEYLSNDLEALPKPLVLVLDDYHRISEPVIHVRRLTSGAVSAASTRPAVRAIRIVKGCQVSVGFLPQLSVETAARPSDSGHRARPALYPV